MTVMTENGPMVMVPPTSSQFVNAPASTIPPSSPHMQELQRQNELLRMENESLKGEMSAKKPTRSLMRPNTGKSHAEKLKQWVSKHIKSPGSIFDES